MIKEIKDFLREIRKMWEPHFVEKIEYKRAKNKKGHYIADDPKTEGNEAWVGGKAPKKKRSKKRGTKTKKRTTKRKNTKKS